MLNIGASKFETNSLFLQPTYSCGKGCQGCYLKEQEKFLDKKNNYPQFWQDLIIDLFHNQKYIKANQVTLALDTLPSKQHLLYTNADREFMLRLAKLYFSAASTRDNLQEPEAHITVNCINDFKQYIEELDMGTGLKLNLVSISNINNLEDIRLVRKLAPGAEINWNILSTSLVKYSLEYIKSILQAVDNMYLLLHKAPLGDTGHNIKSFKEACRKIDELREDSYEPPADSCKLPELVDKVVVDHCMTDARNFKSTGKGCSSNISRFQVWPDGRVTGCAYNSHNQYRKAAYTIQEVVENLKDARNRYEFSQCTIPQELSNIRK